MVVTPLQRDRAVVDALTQGFVTLPQARDHSRRTAFDLFAQAGLPTPQREDWKFTALPPAMFAQAAAPLGMADVKSTDLAPFRIAGDAGALLVLVNGQLRSDLSECSLEGIGIAQSGADGLLGWGLPMVEVELARALVALNGAFAPAPVIVTAAPRSHLAQSLHILHLTVGDHDGAAHARVWVTVGEQAALSLTESHVVLGAGLHWSNPVTVVDVGQGASLRHLRIGDPGVKALQTAYTHVTVERDASYRHVSFATSGRIARHEMAVMLGAPGAQADLSGLALVRGQDLRDHSLRLTHAQPDGQSRQLYKQVADDAGHAVFQGRIEVSPGARRTNAEQLSRSLILTQTAQADAKPELEILNDDVRCSHGATIGDLDRNALFYLQARGLDEAAARGLLIEAFAREVIDGVDDAALRSVLVQRLTHWLSARQGQAS